MNTWIFSESTLAGCYTFNAYWGKFFWIAGQHIDLTRASTFVWRVTSSHACSETVSSMTYTNWERGEPNGGQREQCLSLADRRSYKWHDFPCSSQTCFVCELNLWIHKTERVKVHTVLWEGSLYEVHKQLWHWSCYWMIMNSWCFNYATKSLALQCVQNVAVSIHILNYIPMST